MEVTETLLDAGAKQEKSMLGEEVAQTGEELDFCIDPTLEIEVRMRADVTTESFDFDPWFE